jgi:hypothetical protein
MLDSQHFEFLGDALLVAALAGPGELDDSHYAFPAAYWDAKASRRGVNTCNIFQSNLCITTRISLSCSPVGIHCTMLLRSSNVPLPGKMVPADARVFQRGLLFLFVHWFNEGCYVEGGEIGEEVRFVGKVTKEMRL